MWIVRLALQRPYTFIVMALVIILMTFVVVPRTPTDIFPEINIPVISLVWTYGGLEPQENPQADTRDDARRISTPGNDVEHIEEEAPPATPPVKDHFQPKAHTR